MLRGPEQAFKQFIQRLLNVKPDNLSHGELASGNMQMCRCGCCKCKMWRNIVKISLWVL